MKEKLDKLIGMPVTVIVPIKPKVSVSYMGILHRGSVDEKSYFVTGNPSILFHEATVERVEGSTIIRLY